MKLFSQTGGFALALLIFALLVTSSTAFLGNFFRKSPKIGTDVAIMGAVRNAVRKSAFQWPSMFNNNNNPLKTALPKQTPLNTNNAGETPVINTDVFRFLDSLKRQKENKVKLASVEQFESESVHGTEDFEDQERVFNDFGVKEGNGYQNRYNENEQNKELKLSETVVNLQQAYHNFKRTNPVYEKPQFQVKTNPLNNKHSGSELLQSENAGNKFGKFDNIKKSILEILIDAKRKFKPTSSSPKLRTALEDIKPSLIQTDDTDQETTLPATHSTHSTTLKEEQRFPEEPQNDDTLKDILSDITVKNIPSEENLPTINEKLQELKKALRIIEKIKNRPSLQIKDYSDKTEKLFEILEVSPEKEVPQIESSVLKDTPVEKEKHSHGNDQRRDTLLQLIRKYTSVVESLPSEEQSESPSDQSLQSERTKLLSTTESPTSEQQESHYPISENNRTPVILKPSFTGETNSVRKPSFVPSNAQSPIKQSARPVTRQQVPSSNTNNKQTNLPDPQNNNNNKRFPAIPLQGTYKPFYQKTPIAKLPSKITNTATPEPAKAKPFFNKNPLSLFNKNPLSLFNKNPLSLFKSFLPSRFSKPVEEVKSPQTSTQSKPSKKFISPVIPGKRRVTENSSQFTGGHPSSSVSTKFTSTNPGHSLNNRRPTYDTKKKVYVTCVLFVCFESYNNLLPETFYDRK